MNDAFYTQTGERPDLAAVEYNPPEGYIGTKLLPIVPVVDKAGTVYYNDLTADETAQSDRSAGSGPTGTQIATTSTTFTTAEHCERGKITPDEAKQMGGIEKADMVGAKFAKRNVMNALESAICTDTLGKTASAAFDPSRFFSVVQTALDTVRLYEGKTVLYGGTITFRRAITALLGDSTFGPVLSRTIAGASPAIAASGMNLQAWMNGLAILTGADMVLAGDDTIWNATAVAGRIGIARIDDGSDPLSHKWRPVLGKVFQFMPDGKNPWVIQSVADRVNVNNLYDAYLWFDSVILNTAANYVIDGVTE